MVSQGKIVEMGGYAELSHAGGAFEALMRIQQVGAQADAPVRSGAGAPEEAGGGAKDAAPALGVESTHSVSSAAAVQVRTGRRAGPVMPVIDLS